MDKHQRVQAALRGEAVDRAPLSLWRHYHCEDRTPQGLAQVTLALAHEYDLDLIKMTPCGLYGVEDWAQGCIEFPGTDHEAPFLHTPALTDPADWWRLCDVEPTHGTLAQELEAVRLIAEGLQGETPSMMTIFSPLTLAYKLADEGVIVHLREHPDDLHAGLEIITQVTARFARASLDAGADGFFFATQLASHDWLTTAEYEEFGQRYDLAVLEAVAERSAITVLHLHGHNVFFDLVNRYPIHAVSWHDRETPPRLAEARQQTDRAFLTGLDLGLLDSGPVEAIRAQVREALAQVDGRGIILAPCCVIPTTAPSVHLQAVRDTVSSCS